MGAVLVSSKGQQTPVSIKLNFDCTNNVTEYKVCIVSRQVALEFSTYDLSIFGDSLLIISQIEGKWQARDTKFIPYQKCVSHLQTPWPPWLVAWSSYQKEMICGNCA